MQRGNILSPRLLTLSNPVLGTSGSSLAGFSRMPAPGSILARIHVTRIELLAGLLSKRHANGWDDPADATEQALWTCLVVCRTLLQERAPIQNLNTILEMIDAARLTVDNLNGWESEYTPNTISTYLTSEAGLLFLVLGRFAELSEVLDALKKMQHEDGGWGICHQDSYSRTKATAWALLLYSRCLKSSGAFSFLDIDSYISGIKWLFSAQNENGGWANLDHGRGEFSSVSSTAVALSSLLTTEQALKLHPNPKIELPKKMIRAGLDWLIAQGREGLWIGDKEEFTIKLPGDVQTRRHVSGGLGTLFVAQVLSAAARLDYIRPEDPQVLRAVQNILSRAQPFPNTVGLWIVPSDSNDVFPNSMNSAFALDAFADFEALYLEYLRNGFIEARIIRDYSIPTIRWQRFSLFLFSLMIFIFLIQWLSFLADWFGSQPALIQGIILIVLGAILATVLGRVLRLFESALRKMREMFS